MDTAIYIFTAIPVKRNCYISDRPHHSNFLKAATTNFTWSILEYSASYIHH